MQKKGGKNEEKNSADVLFAVFGNRAVYSRVGLLGAQAESARKPAGVGRRFFVLGRSGRRRRLPRIYKRRRFRYGRKPSGYILAHRQLRRVFD